MEEDEPEQSRPQQQQEEVKSIKDFHNLREMQEYYRSINKTLRIIAKTDNSTKELLYATSSQTHRSPSQSSLASTDQDFVDKITEQNSTFPQPKKPKKRRRFTQPPTTPVITQNRFQPLENIQTTTPASEPAEHALAQSQERCPPIVLHEAKQWNTVSNQLKAAKIAYSKAKATATGINIYPSSVEDFRSTIRLLDTLKVQYHFFKLRSEKALKIVIRGLPISIDLKEIEEDLQEKEYKEFKLTRFTSKEGKPMPLVLVEIPKIYKNLYRETTICGLMVQLESQHKRASTGQCHRCQRYGHAQSGCRADYRCLKCAGGHSTHLCTKPASLPAKCANCAGEHPSSFSGCPENPRMKRAQQESRQNQMNAQALKNHPLQQAWKTKPASNPAPSPLLDSSAFPALPRKPAPSSPLTPPRDNWTSPPGNHREEIAKEIGNIILQFSRLNPSPDQLTEMIATVTRLARLAG